MRLVGYLAGVALAACAVPVTTPVPRLEPPSSWLPRFPGRCLVVQPSGVPAKLAQVFSQSDGLPYRLELAAYVRIEQEGGRVERLRFGSPPSHPVVHAQLERRGCGLAACEPARITWLDRHTVQLERGTLSDGESPCDALLREHPRALELGVRPPSIASGELRETRVVLEGRASGIERTNVRVYASPEAAERALRAALRGQEELPTLSGVPADGLGSVHANTLEQRTFASFADLELALEERTPRGIDPSDRASVYAAFDAAPERNEELLLAARAKAPTDDGLLRRHFQLLFVRDPRAALAMAPSEADAGPAWELRKRAALARFDEAALARALERAHSLKDGTRMARELVAKSQATFEDPAPAQERAEYEFLAAARIGKGKLARVPLNARVPVLELPRLLATLAQAAREDAAVELLAKGRIYTAADDAQLRALGNALAAVTEDGPFELRMAFAQRATLLVAGRREGGWLLIDSGSRVLRGLRWEAIERLVAAPLRQLTGSAFPPDELVIEAKDDAELGALEQSATRVARCTRTGLTLRCRGGLADANAARRALLQVVRDQLGTEARALWSERED